MRVRKLCFHICAFILICTVIGFISANIIAKPVLLTDEEIQYYANVAEKAWYNGLSSVKEYDEIEIKCDLNNQDIYVFPQNNNKQSVTVNFSNDTGILTINEPVVNYWACFIFYGVLFGTLVYAIVSLFISIIKENLSKNEHYYTLVIKNN